MSPDELPMLLAILSRLDSLEVSAGIDLDLLGEPPASQSAFDGLAPQQQSAARAVLKSFEQIEDQLARGFRLLPKLLGEDDNRWFARDHADFAEKLGVLDDATEWSPLVRLRNDLVHDYPLDPATRFDRFTRVIETLPFLFGLVRRLRAFVEAESEGRPGK